MSHTRCCEWQTTHPAAVERLASVLAARARRLPRRDRPLVAPGCYVRAACARLFAECPEDGER